MGAVLPGGFSGDGKTGFFSHSSLNGSGYVSLSSPSSLSSLTSTLTLGGAARWAALIATLSYMSQIFLPTMHTTCGRYLISLREKA